MLQPINGTRLSHEVERQLQRYIVEKRLSVGDLLPGERELSSSFGVSRTVVREALRAMESMGWIEVRQGKGAIIRGITLPTAGVGNRLIQDPALFRELMEVRSLLEVKSASLAARVRTEAELSELDLLLAEMRESVDNQDWKKFALLDVEFHHTIVKAAHNRVLKEMMTSVTRPLLDSRHATVVGLPQRAAKVHQFHQKILTAIRAQDTATAGAVMAQHLETALADFETALTNNRGGEV